MVFSNLDQNNIEAKVIPDSEENKEKKNNPRYLFTDVDGLRVRYTDLGFGDSVVLLLHGFGGDLDNWFFNHDALAEKHRTLALDLPGHGQSGKTIHDPSLSGMATFVSNFLDVLAVPSVHVVGHSMGGAIAMQLLLECPETVKSLGLICSAGLGPEINSDYLRGFVEAKTSHELKQVVQQLFADESLATLQLIEDLLKYKLSEGVEAALNALSETLFSGGVQPVLANEVVASGKPVLVIWGRQDRIIPVSHALSFSATCGQCVEVEIFDSAGHMVQMEKAYDVNRRLLNFLA